MNKPAETIIIALPAPSVANTSSSNDQEPPGACSGPLPPDGGHSPARPSSSAVLAEDAEPDGAGQPSLTATYSPEDNKLRLSSATRLDDKTYARVKAAGFIWAPKQDLFVAPAWTPGRADLLTDLCGEIGDEDTSLVERAEQRAERFEGYRDNRTTDAEAARRAVAAIADNIPLGQPILVGHHSEKHARKDAERIENGMRKAVRMWETANYWKSRAAGAIRHAKYKERPDVRHRRIKGLESDLRKEQKQINTSETMVRLWGREGLTLEQATCLANHDHVRVTEEGGDQWGASLWSLLDGGRITPVAAAEKAIVLHTRTIERARRWVDHITNRLTYERAMLDDAGGLPADRFNIEIGGRVRVKGWRTEEWLMVIRVNRSGGRINSVRTNSKHVAIKGVEEIIDYQPPQGDDAEKVKAATKLPPLVNFPGEGFLTMTKAEWDRKPKDYRITRTARATEQHGPYRYREAFVPGGSFRTAQVFITDAKRLDPSPLSATERPKLPPPEPTLAPPPPREPRQHEAGGAFEAMRESLRAGVQVVTAPQLFPTPAPLAARMVELAEFKAGDRVLEPSAGTGVLLDAIRVAGWYAATVAVEVNPALADGLRRRLGGEQIVEADFLACTHLGLFGRILMNPPFEHGADIKHILHARSMLKPGGLLVAICANGPRQQATLRPLVEACGGVWDELPSGTFADTAVHTVLLTLTGEG